MGKDKPAKPAGKNAKDDKKGAAAASTGPKKHSFFNDDKDDPSYVVPKPCQKVVVRHILCSKLEKLEEARDKIIAGAKFDDVAREYSEDKARHGGLLRTADKPWTKPELHPAFAKVAFEDLPESSTARPVMNKDPIKTKGDDYEGYHILMVEKRLLK